MENPPFWMVFTRNSMGIFMGYKAVSFREGNRSCLGKTSGFPLGLFRFNALLVAYIKNPHD